MRMSPSAAPLPFTAITLYLLIVCSAWTTAKKLGVKSSSSSSSSNDASLYTNKQGAVLYVVPPSAALLGRISSEIGPEHAAIFNSTGKKLKSFKRKDAAPAQWELMADRWIHSIKEVRLGQANVSTIPSVARQSGGKILPLLCAHFASTSPSVLQHIANNMALAGDHCRWAVVFYSGEAAEIAAYRAEAANNPSVVLVAEYKAPGEFVPDFVPKPLMYSLLLPVLSSFQRVWLLDSDLSLHGFSFDRYFQLLKCLEAAGNAPVLVSQPVIRESTQDFPVFNLDFWKKEGFEKYVAMRYDTVEQQAPVFDARFLSWFVARVVTPFSPLFLNMATDWGLDDIWCRAATEFVRQLHNVSSNSSHPHLCGVIVGASISHLQNITGSGIAPKHSKAPIRQWRFNFAGFLANKAFASAFPSWYRGSSGVKETHDSVRSEPSYIKVSPGAC